MKFIVKPADICSITEATLPRQILDLLEEKLSGEELETALPDFTKLYSDAIKVFDKAIKMSKTDGVSLVSHTRDYDEDRDFIFSVNDELFILNNDHESEMIPLKEDAKELALEYVVIKIDNANFDDPYEDFERNNHNFFVIEYSDFSDYKNEAAVSELSQLLHTFMHSDIPYDDASLWIQDYTFYGKKAAAKCDSFADFAKKYGNKCATIFEAYSDFDIFEYYSNITK